ncbi:hypothetical protein D3248_13010 [Leucobacter zeae]|nr:hypothetical protein [Leucobacter zeae]
MNEQRSGGDRATRARRIAVINSNSSDLVTAQLADTAAPHLLPGTDAVFMNPDRGPRGIDTRFDLAVAAVETAALVQAHAADYDAFVVACGNDPGLAAAREATPRPVVGIAEAGFLAACAFGQRFSVAVLAERKAEGMRALVRGYGLEHRLAGVVAAKSSSVAAATDADALLAQLIEGCARTGRAGLGDALVLTGSVMGRIAAPLADAIGIPVVSGFLAGIRLAESLADAAPLARPATAVPNPAS